MNKSEILTMITGSMLLTGCLSNPLALNPEKKHSCDKLYSMVLNTQASYGNHYDTYGENHEFTINVLEESNILREKLTRECPGYELPCG